MKRTPLYDFHKRHGYLGAFGGFEMPLWYKGAVLEHLTVRNNVGVFDVSHMGRLHVSGPQAPVLLDRLLTNDHTALKSMEAQLSFFCNDSGGIIDDVMIFKLNEEEFLLIVNAANREKDLAWIKKNKGNLEVEVNDLTEKVPMVAVQGPKAVKTLQKIFALNLDDLRWLTGIWTDLDGGKVLISRTGYTGEDGFEIYLFDDEAGSKKHVREIWEKILEAGREFGIEPCGLAARDTLRLEAGFCLYGNELNENVTPIEADLEFAVKFDDRQFIGRERLLRQVEEGVESSRISFRMIQRGIPRSGMEIWNENKKIGFVTSGTFSPILKKGIGMGYVPPEYATTGMRVKINVRGRMLEAEVVKPPFYDEEVYGRKRKKNR